MMEYDQPHKNSGFKASEAVCDVGNPPISGLCVNPPQSCGAQAGISEIKITTAIQLLFSQILVINEDYFQPVKRLPICLKKP